jgi:hypothetical protein
MEAQKSRNLDVVKEATFDEVAKQIIKKSFRSAICIDNEYASAYSLTENLNIDEPRALYNSFREEGYCDLDVFEFSSFETSWKPHMGENKDLLILDWELDAGEQYISTLQILDEVIRAKKIPFVVIYTNTEYIDQVANVIVSKFNPVTKEQLEAFKAIFNSKMLIVSEEDSIDFDDLLNESGLFFEYINFHSKRLDAEVNILEWIRKCYKIKTAVNAAAIKSKISSFIKEIFGVSSTGRELEFFSFLILRDEVVSGNFGIKRIKIERPAYFVDNSTTIIVFPKKDKDGGITPEKLFSEFAQTIISDPHNFISLLSLEFKDNIKENFSRIGVKFSHLNERAFLYHMGNYQTDGVFNKGTIYDFILRGWIYELFQQKIGEKSLALNFIGKRYAELNIANVPEDAELYNELVRYSAYISTSDLSEKENKKLWFGDIFKNDKDEYFLCITPHCDCSIPSKIKNNYYFIKGAIKTNVKHALSTAEQGYESFIVDDIKSICLEWKRKPFTSYIENPILGKIILRYANVEKALQYVTSLKENYTQRISNEAFAYGYRVGIDLPHLHGAEDVD